jgi:hypothetical protein
MDRMKNEEKPEHWELSDALNRLANATDVPPPNPARVSALMQAFDARKSEIRVIRGQHDAEIRVIRSQRDGEIRVIRGQRDGEIRGLRSAAWLSGLAAAAALLIAIGLRPAGPARPGPPDGGSAVREAATNTRSGGTQPGGAGEFIPWPGASTLPPLESGELVRMQLPVTMLPTLGIAPPASHVTAVTADIVVGQDGLARAVRLVTD